MFSIPSISRPQSPTQTENRQIKVFSDFDGTISSKDSLKLLLNRFAGPQWSRLEKKLLNGELSESVVLQKAFDAIDLPFTQAIQFLLKEVRIDSGFKPFVQWTKREGVDLTILSGGFENFIRPLLLREGLVDMPVLANQVSVRGKVWEVSACKISRLCELCNHCKTASLVQEIQKNPETFIVYIGDGHTDHCPVQLADLIFAKAGLREYCEAKQLPYVPYETFFDIRQVLEPIQMRMVRRLEQVA